MIAAGYLAAGAKVYISSRKADACEAAVTRLTEKFGGECTAIPADLSTVEGCTALAQAVAQKEQQLDILVNNAGASWGAPLDEFPENGWDKVMDTNVKGIFFLTQQCLPLLRAAASHEDPARVINVGSIDGIKTAVFDRTRLSSTPSHRDPSPRGCSAQALALAVQPTVSIGTRLARPIHVGALAQPRTSQAWPYS